MKLKLALCLIPILAGLLFGLTLYGDSPKAHYKVTRLSPNDVGVACLNGADPTGHKVGDVLILSCGN
jgi:hypothetical protein